MTIIITIVLLLLINASVIAQEPVVLRSGMTISRSVIIKKNSYHLASDSDDGSNGVIRIKGNDLIIDFNDSSLIGTPAATRPDERRGTAIQILGGRNITIKNINVRGYKIGLIARDTKGLRIINGDFSYNYKQHLKSTLEREDPDDWMSYHQNEKDEWMRYGAGIYFRGCDDFEIKDVTIVGGQNGLMLMESNHGKIWNNNFSFLSGIGLGLYRSSVNTVMHNNIDWCVRGYSHGVYNRGQDSAGILIYEQSGQNTFAYNSVTHGGDGFFLWAGQTTMDTGQGGANDNLVYGNDFSHAPTNGIEATFSHNEFINNLVLECWHGVWGGYSYQSGFTHNTFGLNAQAIAIEHGQNNQISDNQFFRNHEAIVLWSNKTEDPNWGYAKYRDTRSRDYTLSGNQFVDTTLQVFNLSRSDKVEILNNYFSRNAKIFNFGENLENVFLQNNRFNGNEESISPQVRNVGSIWTNRPGQANRPAVMDTRGTVLESSDEDYLGRFVSNWDPLAKLNLRRRPEPMKGGKIPFLKKGQIRGRRYIFVDEWGPYDFRSPILIPRQADHPNSASDPTDFLTAKSQRFEILGPGGTWKIARMQGVDWVSSSSGSVPGAIEIRLSEGRTIDFFLELEYRGGVVVSPFGVPYANGKPYRFSYRKQFIPIDWVVKWFEWNENSDPRSKESEFQELLRGEPLKTERTKNLSYSWFGSIGKDLPRDKFATSAEGIFDVSAGIYNLKVTTDDGVRVWIDDRLVIADAWKYQAPTTYVNELKLGGKHRIRVEHFEIDGFATLRVELQPK